MANHEKRRMEIIMAALNKLDELKGINTPPHIKVIQATFLMKKMNEYDTDIIRVCSKGELKEVFAL